MSCTNQRLECAAPKRWSKYTTIIEPKGGNPWNRGGLLSDYALHMPFNIGKKLNIKFYFFPFSKMWNRARKSIFWERSLMNIEKPFFAETKFWILISFLFRLKFEFEKHLSEWRAYFYSFTIDLSSIENILASHHLPSSLTQVNPYHLF